MANLYFSLPVVANAAGAQVDISAAGATKSVVVQGAFTGVLILEISLDAGLSWHQLAAFTAPATKVLPFAAQLARIRSEGVRPFAPFAPVVDIGTTDEGGLFAVIPTPPAGGAGVPLDITTYGLFSTIVVEGSWSGVIAIEIAENGTDFVEIATFAKPGALSLVITGDFVRAVSRGVNGAAPFGARVSFGAINEGGGGAAVNSTLLTWGNFDVAPAADERYLAPGRDNAAMALLVDVQQIVAPRDGTLRNFYVRHNSAIGNGNLVTYKVLVNGVATALTVDLATGAVGQGSDLVNSVAVVAGDRISIRASKDAAGIGSGRIDVQASLEVEA